jgi:HJR/Mrr/RecB family endonuclease
MKELIRPMEPVPEDFGMTLDQYRRIRQERLRLRKERPVPQPRFWLPLCVSIPPCWAVAYTVSGLLGSRGTGYAGLLVLAPLIIAPIWFFVSAIFLAKEEFERARRGDVYEQEPAHLHSVFQKVRLYEQAVSTYQQELARHNHRREQYWKSLGGVVFENELAALYRKLGYGVETTKATGDQGIDLILRKNGATVLVQCKGHSRPIGVGAIRDLYGTLMHHKADRAVLACPVGFTQGVIDFVQGKPIDLISARELVRMAENTQGDMLEQPSDHIAVGAGT